MYRICKGKEYMVKKYKGINSADAPALREKYGTNSLLRIRGKGLLRRFFENLSDPIIKILLIALAIEVIFTFGNCNLIEVFGIVAAILIATSVSTLSEYGSEKASGNVGKPYHGKNADRVLY